MLDRIALGEEVVITDQGEPVAKLVPIPATTKKRGKFRFGSAKGEFTVPDDFNDPYPRRLKTSSGNSFRLEAHRVVRRRPIRRRHRPLIQSQVHAELRPVVHQVIEEHLPVGEKARSAEDGLASEAQLPGLRPGFIRSVLERGAYFGRAFIES